MLRMLWALGLELEVINRFADYSEAEYRALLGQRRTWRPEVKAGQNHDLLRSKENGLHLDPRRAWKLLDVNLEDQSMPVSQTRANVSVSAM